MSHDSSIGDSCDDLTLTMSGPRSCSSAKYTVKPRNRSPAGELLHGIYTRVTRPEVQFCHQVFGETETDKSVFSGNDENHPATMWRFLWFWRHDASVYKNLPIGSVKWRHSNLWLWYGLHVVGMMSYFTKLTGEDLSRYLNNTESVGLRKA